MKLIIDIPEEEYMSLQYHVSIGSGVNANTGECLRNYILEGTQITDGDLISRKSLKKEISRLVVGGENAINDAGYGNFWINGLHSAFRCIDCIKSIGEEYE